MFSKKSFPLVIKYTNYSLDIVSCSKHETKLYEMNSSSEGHCSLMNLRFAFFLWVLAGGLKFFKPVLYPGTSNTFLYCFLPLGSIFDLVRPTNSACNGEKGDKGSCLTSRDCGERGGHNIGVCANGLAICCYCKCCHLVT